ncbi:SDR family oxidoreductase [Bradyrhizobium sp. LTSPM299]|uniref:SDR family oxidoreductase n=1 Tax=Bradyrhizobium sp. LTSPM299 TaxID=1619233 RepID=UPI0006798BDB|nr:SDR family oxidoreductase [Bradyrhizobium sp. LTSPM299]
MTRSALVTGGSGLLGTAIIRQLAARNVPFAAGSRSKKPSNFIGQWKQFDAVTGEGLPDALAGRTMVFNCATSQAKPQQDLAALARLIEAAQRSSLHIVYVGIAGIDEAARHHSYYRMKLDCERMLSLSGISHTVVRPTQFHDFVDFMLGRLTVGPVVLAPKMILQPLDVDFAAQTIVDIALNGPSNDKNIICGPERIETRQLVETWMGFRRRPKYRICAPSIGPLAALSAIQPVAGRTGGLTWPEWNKQPKS